MMNLEVHMPTKKASSVPKAQPSRKAKINPEAETFTVSLPEKMPKGLSFVYDEQAGGWVWRMKTAKAIQAFSEIMRSQAVRK